MTDAADANKETALKAGLRTGSLVIIVLTLIPAVYGFFYYKNSETYFTNHYFRALSEIETQINLGLTGADRLLNYVPVSNQLSKEQLCGAKACHDDPQSKQCKKECDPKYSEYKKFYDEYSDRLKDTLKEYTNYLKKYSSAYKNIQFFPAPKGCENPSKSVDKSRDTTCFLITQTLGNRKVIVFEKEGYLAAKIPLKDFIDPAPALAFFDQLLLLDRSGNLIYRSGYDDLNRADNVTARDDFARFQNLIQYFENDGVTQFDPTSKTVVTKKIKSPSSHSTVREATIGNVSYKLFVQPFHAVRQQYFITGNSSGSDSEGSEAVQATEVAYLVGIVPSNRFFFRVIALPLGRTTMLIFLFLVVVLLTPHLKLFFSGPSYMPSRSFCWGLMVSFPMLVLVVMIGLLSAMDYHALRQSFDDTAKVIASQIKKNFELEYQSIVGAGGWLSKPSEQKDWLSKLQSKYKEKEASDLSQKRITDALVEALTLLSSPKESGFNPASWMGWLSHLERIAGKDKEIREKPCFAAIEECQLLAISDGHYPDFELAFIVNREGKGICEGFENLFCQQLSFRPFPTFNIDVHRRDYFKQPRFFPSMLPHWPGDNPIESSPFFSERIQTYDHGIKLTAFSAPLGEACKEENKRCVAVMIKLMQTFFQPVLPAGFGFAVVKDATGEVLYHSNDQRSLLENFYIETDENRHLIAAVQSRHKQSGDEPLISGAYNGVLHRFHTTPLPHVPWTLILFYDLSSMELVNFKISAIAMARVAMIVVLLGILLVIIYPLICKPLTKLLPNSVLRRRIHQKGGLVDRFYPLFYVALFEFILLLLCLPVANTIYGYVAERQMEQMAKLNLLHVGRALKGRAEKLEIERRRLGRSSAAVSTVLPSGNCLPPGRRYLGNNLLQFALYADRTLCDQPEGWLVGIKIKPINAAAGDDQLSSAQGLIADSVEKLMPLLNPLDARSRQMHFAEADDSSWKFYQLPKEEGGLIRDDLVLTIPQSNKQAEIWLQSPKKIIEKRSVWDLFNQEKDHFSGPFWRVVVRYLGLVLALLLPFYFLYRLMKLTAHRLLGLDFPNRKEWKKLLIDYHQQPLLDLQGYPGMGRKRWAQRNLTRIIDDQTERLLALKCILYNRSQSRVINTDNVEPLMWLIHGRILRMDKKNGMIDFADQTVMDWVKEQPWKQQVHHFLATEQSNPWRILAVPFYVALLMLSVLLLISGSEVGTMLITLLSLVMAGGIPFIGHFLGRFIKG